MNSKVLKPFIPINVSEDKGNTEISLWGRKYIMSSKGIISQIISQGEELLTSPIRVVGTENGKEIVWESIDSFVMNDSDDAKVSVCTSMQSSAFIANAAMNIEYDGFIDMNLTVVPKGRTPRQTMGLDLDGLNSLSFTLSNLYLEIPMKKDAAKFYEFWPLGRVEFDGVEIDTEEEINHTLQSGHITDMIRFPFEEQVYLSSDSVGLGVILESDENMTSPDGKFIEIERRENEVVLRIKLIDGEPDMWQEKGTLNGIDLHPISYKIALMATPVRPFPENPYEERNLHIDCFKKLPVDMSYDEFLMTPFEDTNELAIDRIKRLGVNTLYLHEKWNDMQNSPFLTKRAADRLRTIVCEAHKRGIKVIPYFGYEISTLSPYWGTMGDKIMLRETEKNYNWSWYRQPPQRALKVCYNSDWQDIYVSGVVKMMDEFGFDGIYIDSMVRPLPCMNEKHGCGYRDKDGNLHPTHPVRAIRKLLKRLYEAVTERGGIINNHTCAAFNLAAMPFCHSMWEGEAIQQTLMQGNVKELPDGHFRSVFAGRNLGVPVNMLCYANPPIWGFEQGLSMAVPFGILPKSNDTGLPLEIISTIWELADRFDFCGAKWLPYYGDNDEAVSDNDNVKVSCYKNKGKLLLMIANGVDRPEKAKITLCGSAKRVTGISASCKIKDLGGVLELSAEKFDYAVILVEE